MKDTRKTKLLKSTLNKKLEDFRKHRIANIQTETVEVIAEPIAPKETSEKPKSKGFFSKILKK